jgi:hypothetical protein
LVQIIPAAKLAPADPWNFARAQAFTRLAEGTVMAPGANGAPVADIQIDVDNKGGERLVIGPPCAWCRADVICGRAWKEPLG